MPSPCLLIPAWYALASLATFAALALDKRAARLDRRRTPERTLHILEALGGWPGAWLAIFTLRHKNRKLRYLAVTALATAAHAAAWAWLLLGRSSPLNHSDFRYSTRSLFCAPESPRPNVWL